ncbi:MAG: haloacid dehalogenase type II [Burkholderiales bacterium]|nr:haloacid dehalogenase type II [Burkholderiales bacterium]
MAPPRRPPAARASAAPRALVFDVFGTCVDWRGSIIREGRALNAARGWDIDWEGLVDAWRGAYQPNMHKVRTGELPWTNLDALHLMALKALLPRFLRGTPRRAVGADDLARINTMWHRLRAWPDAVRGLKRLKARHVIGSMSNGNVALLTNMAKFAGLPWDLVFSAEWVRHYKPDRETYLSAPRFLALKPAEVMLVAAHKSDLDGAKKAGLMTCFVPRPLEFGRARLASAGYDAAFEPRFDYNARDFNDLADQLGC